MNLRTILIVTFSILLTSTIGLAHAQTIPANSLTGINVSISPENPKPGQTVIITATSYLFDINSATITWTVDGQVKRTGVGLTTLTTNASSMSKTNQVQITAVSPNGQRYYGSLALKTSDVDMIIESDGYVPPLFLGKISPVYQNSVKITAIPHILDTSGKEYDPTTLIYKWEKDSGEVLGDQGGYGKQSITMEGGIIPRPYGISVEVTSRDGQSSAKEDITIEPVEPSLSFYVNDPLYGPLYNLALGTVLNIGTQKEAGIIAAPFGFNKIPSSWGNISATWTINDIEHPELASNSSIILRAPTDSAGTATVSLGLHGQTNILQSADAGFTVQFK